ncbi:hypothetical protein [Streptomyces sp. NPDC056361]|uniref:hypothetical protein n=1 Tax=Streptomyces sp. NPDC056361 TaxID=3345795 RepID=UPI0035DE4D79
MPTSALDDVTDLLAQALRGSDAGAWIDLDEHLRATLRRGGPTAAAPARSPAAAEREPGVAELAAALCGPDGRGREAALPWAGRSPELLPLVVVRCADWAEPVRVRARAELVAALPELAPEALERLTAVALRTGGRRHGGAARELLTARLREGPEAGAAALLGSGDRAVRRLAHRIAVERGLLSPARLAEVAATDHDVVVQDLCANAALAATGDAVGEAVLGPLLRSRFGRARAAGVTALHRAGRADEAEPFLCDRSGLVRACARWTLRQAGTDPVPLYRAACAAGDAVPSDAPLGLAECGDRATDTETLWALTEHPRPRVRASAVAGLRVLGAARLSRLAPLLRDDSPRVVRETAKALAPWADHFPPDALLPSARLRVVYEATDEEPGKEPETETDPQPEPRPQPAGRARLALRVLRLLRLPFGRRPPAEQPRGAAERAVRT